MSHDLRGKLHQLEAFLKLIEDSCGEALDAEGAELLEISQGIVTLLDARLLGLLTLLQTRERAMERAEVALSDVTAAVLRAMRAQLDEAHVDVDVGAHPMVLGDRRMLEELLTELVSNALQFKKPGAPATIRIQLRQQPEQVTLQVIDRGIGFDGRYKERIFKPYKRLHPEGTHSGVGMGLPVCAVIAERHGGALCATSAPGEGATFSLTLPLASARRGPHGEPSNTGQEP